MAYLIRSGALISSHPPWIFRQPTWVVGQILNDEDVAGSRGQPIPEASLNHISLCFTIHPVGEIGSPLPHVGTGIDAVPNRSDPLITLVAEISMTHMGIFILVADACKKFINSSLVHSIIIISIELITLLKRS